MSLPKEISTAVFKRDKFRCRHCWVRDNLHPHHVVFKSQGGSDALNNLLTLCFVCHRALHDGKLNMEVRGLLQQDLIVRFTRIKGWKP
jgi:5-methylcytosine-specific restriction endonuclease McrA